MIHQCINMQKTGTESFFCRKKSTPSKPRLIGWHPQRHFLRQFVQLPWCLFFYREAKVNNLFKHRSCIAAKEPVVNQNSSTIAGSTAFELFELFSVKKLDFCDNNQKYHPKTTKVPLVWPPFSVDSNVLLTPLSFHELPPQNNKNGFQTNNQICANHPEKLEPGINGILRVLSREFQSITTSDCKQLGLTLRFRKTTTPQ